MANTTVKININGVDYTRVSNENGVASMAVNLPSGDYDVAIQCNSTKTNSKIIIKPTVSGNNIAKMFRNETQYYAKFLDSAGNTLTNHTSVTFNINGVLYTRYTNASGVARLNINLNP